MDRRPSPDTDEYPVSVISLQELDPSPIDTPVDEPNDASVPSGAYIPLRAAASALGLGGHDISYYLTRIQKYSSYTFTLFLGLHVTNTSILPLLTRSVKDSEAYLLLTRPFYQSPLTEPFVVALPLLAHIGSGVALRLYRRHQLAKRYGYGKHEQRQRQRWPSMSGTSLLGYMLLPLVAGHVFLSRVLPLWIEGDSSNVGLAYVSHGCAKQPVIGFVGFSALIAVGAWHFVWGGARWLKLTPKSISVDREPARKQRWYVLNALSAGVAGLWVAGGLGVVGRGGTAGGWEGRNYDMLFSSIPVLGRWL